MEIGIKFTGVKFFQGTNTIKYILCNYHKGQTYRDLCCRYIQTSRIQV